MFEKENKRVKEARKLLENLADRGTHWEYHQKDCGAVYDKKPFKVLCKEGKMYMWCACGWSKQQPFCDGTHNIAHYKITQKPIPFTCKETKEYWFCNCKQTKHRPFCDGIHKNEDVQKAHSVVKH
ncbi:CDGSH iron-sulfur domain-containing protein 3-like protein [Leptotrombidium deliense]|uniref:CDGSH iron-sulfur domain-containing protein 3-like protein n=1 Tax=Leptotrombidium deliense TaxID=299467 RepID=A0A443SQQ4_9ACAR|nr:CDGSH iron-sulfur domain-containing protein 3-like protein [Leptotrombidium deliense]